MVLDFLLYWSQPKDEKYEILVNELTKNSKFWSVDLSTIALSVGRFSSVGQLFFTACLLLLSALSCACRSSKFSCKDSRTQTTDLQKVMR